jgi:hypothetical protein
MTSDFYEAIMFFDQDSIVKEMRYNEFEAVLDGVVGIPVFKGKKLQASYVSMTAGLDVTACVLFVIRFDQKGFADSDWNIPLRHLASKGRGGPDMGVGPIRLSCKSQCAIAWYQKELWEPPEQGGFDPFTLIQRAIARNKLGFKKEAVARAEVNIPVISDVVSPQQSVSQSESRDNDYEAEIKKLKAQAAEKIEQLEATHAKEIDQVSRAFRNEKLSLHEQFRTVDHQLREQSVFHDTLKTKYLELQGVKDTLRMEKVLLEDRVAALEDAANALNQAHMEQKGSVEANESALNAKNNSLVSALEIERFQVARLKEKLALTEADRRKMVTGFVQQLKDQDLLFVAYHLGAGHISLSADVLQEYLDNPEAFAAQKCNVSLEHYQLWVNHYEMPHCDMCSKTLTRIGAPGDFVLGVHNFCEKHKTLK